MVTPFASVPTALPAIDVLILCALQDELEAVLAVDKGRLANWLEQRDRGGFRWFLGSFDNIRGGTLRIAAAWAGEMGRVAAATRAQQLIHELNPACLAMCGICAGDRKRVALGDVIVANSLYSYDEGKVRASEGKPADVWHNLQTFDLEAKWRMDAAFLARELDVAKLQAERPKSRSSQQRWLLSVLLLQEDADGDSPASHTERKVRCPDWTEVVREAQKAGLVSLRLGKLSLTTEGREQALNDRILYVDGLPEDPPLQVRVGAIATGASVQEDPTLFDRLRRLVRTTLGVEMEGAAIGETAARFGRRMVVIKAVSDHADEEKDDNFRRFACRASAEVLIEFLLKYYDTEPNWVTLTPEHEGLSATPEEIDAYTARPEHRRNDGGQEAQVAKITSLFVNLELLGVHSTKARWARISKSAPPELIEKWINVVEDLPHDVGAIASLFVAMWKEALLLDLVPYVHAVDGRMDLNALKQLYLDKKSFWGCLSQGQMHSIGPRVYAREAEFGWRDGAWEQRHSLAGPLFELMWEVLKALNRKSMTIDEISSCWWHSAGGIFDEEISAVFPWPGINPITFSEHESIAAEWNKSYLRAKKVYKHVPNDAGVANDLAYRYVETIHALWHQRHYLTTDWRGAVAHLLEGVQRFDATPEPWPDERPYVEWARAVPILAAPESGLGSDVAEAILVGAALDEAKLKALHTLRLDRFRASFPGQDPDAALALIDAKYLGHPWVQRFRER